MNSLLKNIFELESKDFVLIGLVCVKFVLFALTPFASDFINWTMSGIDVTQGKMFLGVYTGPAYIYAATYSVWRLAGGDPSITRHLVTMYNRMPIAPFKPIPLELFAFTFVMKLPLVLWEIFTIILIMRIVREMTRSRSIARISGLLWASSPLVFLSESVGTSDLYAGTLILLGVFMLYRSRIKTASLSFALGSILRLSPLLISWVYIIALARLRKRKELVEFLAIQLSFVIAALVYAGSVAGMNAVFEVFTPSYSVGVLLPEALSAFGPLIPPRAEYNQFGLGLSLTFYLLVAAVLTRPAAWLSREMGSEALAIFGIFFAFTEYFPQFLTWMLPLFVVYASATGFGSRRFLLVTLLGAAKIIFANSKYFAGYGNAVFFIPNMNDTMVAISSLLLTLDSMSLVVTLLQELFGALLLFTALWVLLHHRADMNSI